MFGTTLDIFLSILLSVLAVVFLMGKGKGILELFGGKNQTTKKRSKEEELAYQKMIGYFMIPLAVTEIISIFVQLPIMGLILAAVAIVDLIFFARKTKGM